MSLGYLAQMSKWFKLILTLAATSFLAPASSAKEPPKPKVTLPGQVLVDIQQRRQVISSWPTHLGRAYCRPERVCSYDPVKKIDSKNRVTGQTAARQGLSLWAGVSEYLRTGSLDRLRHSYQALYRWVRADALQELSGHMPLSRHFMKRHLLPTITAYAVMRKLLEIPETEHQQIKAWLAGRVALVDQNNHNGRILSDGNNSRFSRDAVNMAWGILVGDNISYQKGIDRYRAALTEMKEDGSFPWEMIRKSKAVSYQNLAISILIPMAEMAYGQGYDLYSEGSQGRTIHLAVSFLLAAERDSIHVQPYTKEKQDKIRLGNHLHWTELYLARFPDHPNAKGLHDLRQRHHFLTGRSNDFSGGNLSCAFANPETNPFLNKRPPRKKVAAIRKTSIVPRVTCPKYLE